MITTITGPMFSGKSTRLLAEYDNITDKSSILCFKSSKDKRDKTKIRARNVENKIDAIVISKFEDILDFLSFDIKYIFIDEVQFISGDYMILNNLSINNDIDIYIVGLSQTSEHKPFGCMPNILAISNNIYNLKARCSCGKTAYYTYCKVNKKDDVLIGDIEYEPICRKCLVERNKDG